MSVVRNRGLFTWISALLLCGTATGQQNMLWRGVVKPEAINVYQSASTNEHVTATLRQGDAVDVVLEIALMGDEWCRVARPVDSEPLGYVLCFNLEQKQTALPRSRLPTANQLPRNRRHNRRTKSATTVVNPAVLSNKDILDMNKSGLPAGDTGRED